MSQYDADILWMQHALRLAHAAEAAGEVPVGAVLVKDDVLLAEGSNQPIAAHDPSAHAEIVTLRRAGDALDNYRLVDTTLYVTLEPCMMCAGALVQARIQRLVFGAFDPKAGAVHSVFQALDLPALNHRIAWEGGVMADECGQLLKDFFAVRRTTASAAIDTSNTSR